MEVIDFSKAVTNKYREKRIRTAKKIRLDERALRSISEAWTVGELEAAYDLGCARRDAVDAAKELFYDQQCIKAILKANSESEIEHALIAGRHRRYA